MRHMNQIYVEKSNILQILTASETMMQKLFYKQLVK